MINLLKFSNVRRGLGLGMIVMMSLGLAACSGTDEASTQTTTVVAELSSAAAGETASEKEASTTATGIYEFTMDDIANANTTASLLFRHGGILTHLEGPDVSFTDQYVSADVCYVNSTAYQFLVDWSNSWYYMEVDGQMYFVYNWYAMSDTEKESMCLTPEDYSEAVVNDCYTRKEVIQNIEDNGDGTLRVTTLLGAEDFYDSTQAKGEAFPEEYEGCDKEAVYVIDKDTLEIQSCEENVLNPTGAILYGLTTVSYDAEKPEGMQNMLSMANEFQNDPLENQRTITVVYDAGTDKEETYSYTIDPQYKILVYYRDGYDDLYNDPEKTEAYTGGDGVSDVTIYAFQSN